MKQKFFRKVLSNGMTILLEKRDLPIVSVAYAVRFGGYNEKLAEKGIAHFIEHLMYKGTKTRSAKKISEAIERNGGKLNGFTDETMTAYYCKMPSDQLNTALDVLTDMVKHSLFDAKELEKERKVIFEEMKMRRDMPQVYVFDKIQSFLYGGTLGKDLIGTPETMGKIDRKAIVSKFKEVYTPNNLILCVVGDADFDSLVAHCEKHFGKEKGTVPQFEIEEKNEEHIEKRKGIDQANLVFAFHVPTAQQGRGSYASFVLSSLMGSGLSSRLFQEIREKRNLAYGVHATVSIEKDFGYLIVYVGTMKEHVEEVKQLIIKEFKKVSKGLSQEELDSVKAQILGQHAIGMEDSATQMTNLLQSEIRGDAREFYDFEKHIRAVTLQEVKELADVSQYSFFALIPE